MEPLVPEHARWIQRCIDELRVDSAGDWPLRICKEQLNALPLAGNSIYIWALRPDGSVVCLDHEAFALPWEVETNPVVIYAVLLQGVDRYPELQALVPPQPLAACRCGACAGTGAQDREGHSVSCLSCNGLGWYRMD
jgi:hypothetical protein